MTAVTPEIAPNSWVRIVAQSSDHWAPNEDGSYPQPLTRRKNHFTKEIEPETRVDLVGQLGEVKHVVRFPEEGKEEDQIEASYAVRLPYRFQELCPQDWYLFRASDLEVVEPTPEEQWEFIDSFLSFVGDPE